MAKPTSLAPPAHSSSSPSFSSSSPPPRQRSQKRGRSKSRKGGYTLEQCYFQSARKGEMDGLIAALTQGVDPHTTDSKKRNIVHQLAFYLPCNHNHNHNNHNKNQDFLKEIFNFFLSQKIDLNVQDNEGETPLHLCARKGNVPVITYLLKNGAKMELLSHEQVNPFHLAAECNSSDALKAMYHMNPLIIDALGPDGWSCLHFACSGEALLSLVVLLDRGANASAFDDDGNTPLHISCIQASGKNTEIIRRLLMSGANPSAPNLRKRTPLHFAVRAGFQEAVVQLIGAHVDVNIADISGDTALHIAVRDGHCSIASKLLKANAKNNSPNKRGETALESAKMDRRMIRLMNDPSGDWRVAQGSWLFGGYGFTFAVVFMSFSVGWFMHKKRFQLFF